MSHHRTIPPAPPSWAPGGHHRFVAPPVATRPAVAIPRPRPVPPSETVPAGRPRPYAGPPVPVVRIRPGFLWVGLSWLLFGVLVLAGVAMFWVGAAGATPEAGPDRSFGSGEVTTLELDADTSRLIFAELGGGGYVRCEPVGQGADDLRLTPTTTDWSVQVRGREWLAAFELDPAVAGTYQIICDGPGASFAVGDQAGTAAGGSAVMALFVLPLVGLGTAGCTTIVVLTRQGRAQDRLVAR